jgi:co-chaperonin GroES (HSP10)
MTTRTPQGLQIKREAVYSEAEIAAAFPDVDPGFVPFGTRVIVQLRSAKTKSAGGIILTDETIDVEKWNTQIAKVRAIGPMAFKDRRTSETWPEGEWCKVGEYVRIPKFNQDKWFISFEDHEVLFMLVNDLDLLAKKTGNPLEVKAYI